jgi:hypothetical protein
MSRTEKSEPLVAFHDNMSDARVLVAYARAFQNNRKRSMRPERRTRVGDAFDVPVRDRKAMAYLKSDDLFVVCRDSARLGPEQFADPRPLLRQAVVAACAALETYVADKVMDFVAAALRADPIPPRLQQIPLTVGRWSAIEQNYARRKWGIRGVIEDFVRETSSTAPSKIGETLALIGFHNWSKSVDTSRSTEKGATVRDLEALTARRNQIAHSADRKKARRGSLTIGEVDAFLALIDGVAGALDDALGRHSL